MKNTAKRIKKYKELKADIVDIDIKIQVLGYKMMGYQLSHKKKE